MKRFLAGTLVTLASLTAATAAQATPETRYFECGAQTPLTNLTEPAYTWTATAPATSMQDGGGCYSADFEALGATFGGTYAGEVEKLDLTLYGISNNPAFDDPSLATITLSVDGEVVYTSETEFQGVTEKSGPLASAPGGSFKTTWSLEDLHIPATAQPKTFEITVTDPYFNDWFVFGRGASDQPSGVKLYTLLDLPKPDPEDAE